MVGKTAERPSPLEPLALRVPDACRVIGIGRTKLYGEAKAGRVKLIRIGGRTLVPMDELRRLIAEAA
jgi:hypothetical protein